MTIPRICSVTGCRKHAVARGWCNTHWNRWRKHGDPTYVSVAPKGAPRAFLEAAITTKTNECINWPFCRNDDGYGEIYVEKGNTIRVHIEVCSRVHGERPTPLHVVRHLCGKGHLGCINPSHLCWGTRKENSADSQRHGTTYHGEQKARATFRDTEILDIRKRLATGERAKDIAFWYNVDPRRITEIKKGRVYATIRERT